MHALGNIHFQLTCSKIRSLQKTQIFTAHIAPPLNKLHLIVEHFTVRNVRA